MVTSSFHRDHAEPPGELWQSMEGRIFLAGLFLALLLAAWLTLNFLLGSPHAHVLVAMTTTNVLFGRAAGMSFGYSMGFGHGTVIGLNLATETILVTLAYPLFVFSWHHLLEIRMLKRAMARLRAAAHRHEPLLRRYGVPGLFLFVFFPFWMTGPVVGAIVGFLVDFSPLRTMAIVLSGTFLAMFTWAVILHELHDLVAAYSPYGPMVLLLIIILLAVAGSVLQRRNHRGRSGGTDRDG